MACCCCCCRALASCAGITWLITSLLSAGLAAVGFYAPYWISGHMDLGPSSSPSSPTSASHPVTVMYAGVWRRCNYPVLVTNDSHQHLNNHHLHLPQSPSVHIVLECGRYASFSDIPSIWWKISTVIMACGTILLFAVIIFLLMASCCSHVIRKTSAQTVGCLQLIAGKSIIE